MAVVIVSVLLLVAVTVMVSLLTFGVSRRHVDNQTLRVALELASTTAATAKNVDRKLEDIHMLVNSRLDEALSEIKILRDRLGLTEDEPSKEEVSDGQA